MEHGMAERIVQGSFSPDRLAESSGPISLDLAVFTLVGRELSVLLTERTESPYPAFWALPGALRRKGISLDAQARSLQSAVTGSKVGYSPIAFQLLPSEFTITELQQVYEAVLGLSINRGNFWRKVVDRGVIEPTGKERNVRGKRAYLFRFSQQPFGLREEPDGFIEA